METHGFDTFPLLVRPGAVIPFNPTLKTPEGKFTDGLQVLVNGTLVGKREVDIVMPDDVGTVGITYTIGGLEQTAGVEVVDLAQRSSSLG